MSFIGAIAVASRLRAQKKAAEEQKEREQKWRAALEKQKKQMENGGDGGGEVEMHKSASRFIMSDDLLVGRHDYHVPR